MIKALTQHFACVTYRIRENPRGLKLVWLYDVINTALSNKNGSVYRGSIR